MYVLIKNEVVENYPYSVNQLYADNPNTSFPSPTPQSALAEFGMFPVIPTPQPAYDNVTQNLIELDPLLEAGLWIQQWAITQASPEEIAVNTASQAAKIRKQRNDLLADCDWTQLSDAPVNGQDWAIYRQALRDISNQTGFPLEVIFPKDPNYVDQIIAEE